MAHAWKACWVNALTGSNPVSSAALARQKRRRPGPLHLGDRAVVSVSVSIAIRTGPSAGPEQAPDLVRDLPPDRVGDVLGTGPPWTCSTSP